MFLLEGAEQEIGVYLDTKAIKGAKMKSLHIHTTESIKRVKHEIICVFRTQN
jgi:hypothetical protein